MSDPLTSAVLSLFQVSARAAAQCPPPRNFGNFNSPGGTQTCNAGAGGRNFFNFNFGGAGSTQNNTAGVSKPGAPG